MVDQKSDKGFGVEQLDNIAMGSIFPGSLGLFYGPAGTGKSSLLAHFLFKGAENDQNVCFITAEPPTRLANNISRFKKYKQNWIRDGYISILNIHELCSMIGLDLERSRIEDMDLLLDLLFQTFEHLDLKRAVIDPFNQILMNLDRHGKGSFLGSLKGELHRKGITGFLCLDTKNPPWTSTTDILQPDLFDIIVRFRKEEEPPTVMNTLTIERWKSTGHAKNTYVVDISEKGIILVPRIKPLEVR